MTRPALHPRPAGLPESVRHCGWCGAAWQKSFTHTCPSRTELPPGPSARAMPVGGSKAGRSHYAAVRTTCERGHSHPSKTEARACAVVYARWAEECANWGYVIHRNVRLPLWSLGPTDAGIPHYGNIDFVVFSPHEPTEIGFTRKHAGAIVALIDAKCGRRSRDWERGRAAAQATYGVPVEELEV